MLLVPRWFIVMLCLLAAVRSGLDLGGAHGIDAALDWICAISFGINALIYLVTRRA